MRQQNLDEVLKRHHHRRLQTVHVVVQVEHRQRCKQHVSFCDIPCRQLRGFFCDIEISQQNCPHIARKSLHNCVDISFYLGILPQELFECLLRNESAEEFVADCRPVFFGCSFFREVLLKVVKLSNEAHYLLCTLVVCLFNDYLSCCLNIHFRRLSQL